MRIDTGKGLTSQDLASPLATYMVPAATAFYEELSIEEVLIILRKRSIEHLIRYFYAVDDEHRITGIVSTRDLLLSDPSTKLADIVDETIYTAHETDTLEHGLRLLEKHGIQALPIVDDAKHLKGVFELIPEQEFTSKDVFQLIGLSLHLGKLDSTRQEYRYRMPWLLCNIVAGLICATIGAYYSPILSKYVVLATFIPLVLSLGESVAMQSMTLSMHFLHFGKVHVARLIKRIVLEWKTTILLGITSAFIIGSIFWIWANNFHTMLAVSISIFIAMIVSSTLGSLFPIILHTFSLDPKVASGPVVLMLTDILTTSTYLAFSNWLLTTFA